MLKDQRILVTGVTGAIALPVARFLAKENHVFGAARLEDPARRAAVEAAGVTPCPIDLGGSDLSALPERIDYVLHYAYARRNSGEFDEAIEVNGVGTGRVLAHCRDAKAALVMSSGTVYSTRPGDPHHAFRETDDIGQASAPWAPSAPTSKVAMEAVARFCAEHFDLPTVIVRPSSPYGTGPDVPGMALQAALAGASYPVFHDPQPYSTIHIDDMCREVEALLGAASVPANVVNWASDEVVTMQEMAEMIHEFTGKTLQLDPVDVPGAGHGYVLDASRCRAITGPPTRDFRAAFEAICRAAVEGD
ncbi:MAG: NAD(P)-dependent oxidoreductase [bacterium]|nr:NAD(P)-dependent oxidoreductase [bacterium]